MAIKRVLSAVWRSEGFGTFRTPCAARLLTVVLIAAGCCAAGGAVGAQIHLTPLRHLQVTPNEQDSSGVFCRTFHHPGRNMFYVTYAGRPSAAAGPQRYYRWREYDADFEPTGRSGTLPGFGSNVGDYAMLRVDSTYYHVAGTAGHAFKLTRFNDDFQSEGSTIIPLDPSDGTADMILDYANGRLILGALHQEGVTHPTFPMQTPSWTPVMHKWEFDLDLGSLAAPVYLNPTFSTWGGSCVFNGSRYFVVTQDSFPAVNLEAYEYDTAWNHLGTHHLSSEGQWSQGVLWDGTYYFVAYHSGRQHHSGNITVAVFDAAWTPVYSTVLTNYANYIPQVSPPLGTRQENANRPYLTRVGQKLYVSYDVDAYVLNAFPTFYTFEKRWQSHVMELQIDEVGDVPEPNTPPVLRVYPNPTSGELSLNAELPIERVDIVDAGGRVVRTLTAGGDRAGTSWRMELADLPRGVYLARARTAGGGVATRKFVRR